MNKGWVRIREAAHLMGLSDSTVRRRVEGGDLRGRMGKSGRQEVFLSAQMLRDLESVDTEPLAPGHLERGSPADDEPVASKESLHQALKNAANDTKNIEPPADSLDLHEDSEADQLKRFERLAGGSLMLAQQRSEEMQRHSDEAHEQLAHTRWQVRQVRKVAMAGWACTVGAIAVGLVLTLSFGFGMNKAQAQARANEDAVMSAKTQIDNLTRDLASAQIERDTAMSHVELNNEPATQAATPSSGVVIRNTAAGRRGDGPTALIPSN